MVAMTSSQHVYEVTPRKDNGGADLISDVLPFGRLWYTKPNDAIDYAKFFSRSRDAVVRVYDAAGNVTEPHPHADRLRLGFQKSLGAITESSRAGS